MPLEDGHAECLPVTPELSSPFAARDVVGLLEPAHLADERSRVNQLRTHRNHPAREAGPRDLPPTLDHLPARARGPARAIGVPALPGPAHEPQESVVAGREGPER